MSRSGALALRSLVAAAASVGGGSSNCGSVGGSSCGGIAAEARAEVAVAIEAEVEAEVEALVEAEVEAAPSLLELVLSM